MYVDPWIKSSDSVVDFMIQFYGDRRPIFWHE